MIEARLVLRISRRHEVRQWAANNFAHEYSIGNWYHYPNGLKTACGIDVVAHPEDYALLKMRWGHLFINR